MTTDDYLWIQYKDGFQLTRSRGAWQFNLLAVTWLCKFQLTRSRGAWHLASKLLETKFSFQLTRSRGAWQFNLLAVTWLCKFQLTRSRGAWRLVLHEPIETNSHFNSHAHVERDFGYTDCILYATHISTHTLTWSVTSVYVQRFTIPRISTHTLTWSVTLKRLYSSSFFSKFQLTRSRGAWLNSISLFVGRFSISTHTLTWSVTLWQPPKQPCTSYFNSHAHVERDRGIDLTRAMRRISTHTLTWSVT